MARSSRHPREVRERAVALVVETQSDYGSQGEAIVFIPAGCTEPLSALRNTERAHVFDRWAKQSVFTQFGPEHLTRERLIDLLAENHRAHRLAIGAAAVERAIQRRKLELLVVATGLEKAYARTIEAVVERNGHTGPLLTSDLTRDELGQAAGVRRAGCVGLLRGHRHAFIASQ
jgi:ribosomal protein L7Ae-like RNA K-turn-binding protein